MTPSTNPARDEAALDHERIPAWPPLKHALWMVVTGEKLNDGHYINAYQLTDKLYEAALSAAKPSGSGVDAVAVKPLEWFEGLAVLPEQHASAQSVIGSYKAITFLTVGREPSLVSYWHGPEGRDIRVESFDEAKAAAQADYEQRIRSALSPAATSGSEAGGDVLAGWCQPNGITKQAQYDIDQAIGGTYELPDGRSFWLDHVAVKEIMRRAIPYIAAECERHRLVGGRTAISWSTRRPQPSVPAPPSPPRGDG